MPKFISLANNEIRDADGASPNSIASRHSTGIFYDRILAASPDASYWQLVESNSISLSGGVTYELTGSVTFPVNENGTRELSFDVTYYDASFNLLYNHNYRVQTASGQSGALTEVTGSALVTPDVDPSAGHVLASMSVWQNSGSELVLVPNENPCYTRFAIVEWEAE